MALVKCKECGSGVSTQADSCPRCGANLKKTITPLSYFLIGVLILIVLGAIWPLTNGSFTSHTSKPAAGFEMPSVGREIVTFGAYSRIQNGMGYRQVVEIIGTEGQEMSRNKMDAVPGVMSSIETVMYQWANGNGSNMNAMFQNDKLIQKAQFGLR